MSECVHTDLVSALMIVWQQHQDVSSHVLDNVLAHLLASTLSALLF